MDGWYVRLINQVDMSSRDCRVSSINVAPMDGSDGVSVVMAIAPTLLLNGKFKFMLGKREGNANPRGVSISGVAPPSRGMDAVAIDRLLCAHPQREGILDDWRRIDRENKDMVIG